VRNRCINHKKKNNKHFHQEISRSLIEKFEDKIDTDTLNKPTIEILEELLEKISGEGKLILLLKYKEGWSIETIQKSLNLSESAVKMRLSRIKGKLNVLLEKYSTD